MSGRALASHTHWATDHAAAGGRATLASAIVTQDRGRTPIGVALLIALSAAACQAAPSSRPTEGPTSATPRTATASPERTLAPSPTTSPPCALGMPVNLGPGLNTSGFDGGPTPSFDGLRLYFVSTRPGGQGGDIWVAERPNVDAEFGRPSNL